MRGTLSVCSSQCLEDLKEVYREQKERYRQCTVIKKKQSMIVQMSKVLTILGITTTCPKRQNLALEIFCAKIKLIQSSNSLEMD